MTIESDVQKTAIDSPYIELYELDATALGGTVYRAVNGAINGSAVQWRGATWSPYDVEVTGFEASGKGMLPTPTLKIGDATGLIRAATKTYDQLRGAKFTRYRTFKKYLTGQPEANDNRYFPLDIFRISQKTRQEGIELEFKLVAMLSIEGMKLPKRLVLRDICTHSYRTWTGAAFDYSKATCPYTGTTYKDQNGNACAQSLDSCGRQLSDCKARFGSTAVLPTWAFPGVSNVRR
jgi:lambda family phage minor tail protein L